MEPRHKFEDGSDVFYDDKKYQKMIDGLNRRFWEVVYNGISFEDASKMSSNDLLEAHAALCVFDKEAKKKVKGGVKGGS